MNPISDGCGFAVAGWRFGGKASFSGPFVRLRARDLGRNRVAPDRQRHTRQQIERLAVDANVFVHEPKLVISAFERESRLQDRTSPRVLPMHDLFCVSESNFDAEASTGCHARPVLSAARLLLPIPNEPMRDWAYNDNDERDCRGSLFGNCGAMRAR